MTIKLIEIIDGEAKEIFELDCEKEVTSPDKVSLLSGVISRHKSWPEVLFYRDDFWSLEDFDMANATYVKTYGLWIA